MTNRLADETSPYLLQHAANPVDWWPWCDEALQQARLQNKPILLSIGYSACHWCHVMAEESFEDAQTAALMNEWFINIKVDREERPDLDQIYQTAHMLLAHRPGGWPLTLALTPAGVPFFAGTYFPKFEHGEMPAFAAVLEHVSQTYQQHHQQLEEMGPRLVAALNDTLAAPSPVRQENERLCLEACVNSLLASHDRQHGGFHGAPKFPHPAELALLMRFADVHHHEDARQALLLSLRSMAKGGLYDHLGGGFSRYCIDHRWRVPHFEKMLGDNGLLLLLYAQACAREDDAHFQRVIHETTAWLLREMRGTDNCFHASIDADSEGQEGHFYLWSPAQAEALLDPEQLALISAHYGLDRPPNFEQRLWHLYEARPLEEVAHTLALPLHTARMHVDHARATLLAARSQRIPPEHDSKILVTWNAFAIRALAQAALLTGQNEWRIAAQTSMDFIRTRLWQERGLLTAWNQGCSRTRAYLEDHAALIQACLALLECEFRPDYLAFAQTLADELLTHFEDKEQGGFFFTADDEPVALLRFKPWHDAALPSGNGLAAQSLIWLGHVCGETRFLRAAERTLACFRGQMQTHPGAVASLALALDDALHPPQIVAIHGQDAAARLHWQQSLLRIPGHTRRIVFIIGETQQEDIPVFLRASAGTAVWAQVCTNHQCLPAFTTLHELIETLKNQP